MPEIVQLRGGGPRVNDIPAMLRKMADDIEAGSVDAASALFVIPRDDDWPVCEMAKTWFVNNLVAR